MNSSSLRLLLAALTLSLTSLHASAQDAPAPDQAAFKAKLEQFQKTLQPGPITGKLGNMAQLEVPEGLVFTGKSGTTTFLEMTHNIPGGSELGMVAPKELSWFVTFDYSAVGHVKDDDKDELDADKLLESIKEGTKAANEELRRRGWPENEVVGWYKPPFYDPNTHNLTWSIRGRSEGSETINWSTRLLGRTGIVNVDLVADPSIIDATVPVLNQLLTGFNYVQGQTYGEFKPGDKIAEYGLAALVAGGAGVLAAKTGLFAKLGILLAKLWKVILIGLAAVGASIKKLFGFGKKSDATEGNT